MERNYSTFYMRKDVFITDGFSIQYITLTNSYNFHMKYVNVKYDSQYKGGPQIQSKVLGSSFINQSLSVWLCSICLEETHRITYCMQRSSPKA